MAATSDWNTLTIDEFRANEGRVGGAFEGAPITLVHHRGRRSGAEYVTPVMYLASDDDASTIYVFASKAGAPTHPDWYYNLRAAGLAEVEVGTETYQVTVSELLGAERDRIYEKQARLYPASRGTRSRRRAFARSRFSPSAAPDPGFARPPNLTEAPPDGAPLTEHRGASARTRA